MTPRSASSSATSVVVEPWGTTTETRPPGSPGGSSFRWTATATRPAARTPTTRNRASRMGHRRRRSGGRRRERRARRRSGTTSGSSAVSSSRSKKSSATSGPAAGAGGEPRLEEDGSGGGVDRRPSRPAPDAGTGQGPVGGHRRQALVVELDRYGEGGPELLRLGQRRLRRRAEGSVEAPGQPDDHDVDL